MMKRDGKSGPKGLQSWSRNFSFMTVSTQLQDTTNLFSHIFQLFQLFLELQNLKLFQKVVYEVTKTFRCQRGYTCSSTKPIFSSKTTILFELLSCLTSF